MVNISCCVYGVGIITWNLSTRRRSLKVENVRHLKRCWIRPFWRGTSLSGGEGGHLRAHACADDQGYSQDVPRMFPGCSQVTGNVTEPKRF